LDVKTRFTEEQIIGFLREAEAGVAVKDMSRHKGFSPASFYQWRAKYGGMSVSEAKRLKALEVENTRLKKLLADALLENEVTREALKKRMSLKILALAHNSLLKAGGRRATNNRC
jgi:putative transposase